MSSVLTEPIQDSVKLIMSKQDYVTGIETCKFQYDWTIKNFSQRANKLIKSPSFSSHYADFDDKWILRIYSDCMPTAEGTILICAILKIQSFNKTNSQLRTKFRISMNDIKEIIPKYNFNRIPGKTQWVRYRTNLSCQLSNPSQYFPNDELKICCTITMSRTPKNDYSDIISRFNATPKLSVDWKKLLLSEKSADVTIKVGQKSFRAIKGILAIRSPVFSAMFDHEEFKENEKNEVAVEDIEEDVFEEFLHYIYTDESPNVDKMPMELLAVADKYQVDCLKNICEEVICKTINVDNVASILVFSDKYNLEKLDKKCLEFIKKNLQAVLSNEAFQVYKKKYPEIFVGALEELLLSADSVNYTIE